MSLDAPGSLAWPPPHWGMTGGMPDVAAPLVSDPLAWPPPPVESPVPDGPFPGPPETTPLDPAAEDGFRAWAAKNKIADVDSPDAHYDYRGFYQATGGADHKPGDHFPDTFKQHGHPTFSTESKYSAGPGDGGHWNGDAYVPGGAGADLPPPDGGPVVGENAGRGLAGAESVDPTARETARDNRLSPEDFAVKRATMAHAQEMARARMNIAADTEYLRGVAENKARYEQATAAAAVDLADVTAKAKAMADSTPFEQWWSTRSGGQKAAGYVSAILGGFILNQTNGRNAGVDFLTKMADDDAAQKWASIRERRGIANDQIAHAGDDLRNRDAIKLAAYEVTARGIESQLQMLDPQGTAAMHASEAVRGVRAAAAAAAYQMQKDAFERQDKTIKQMQEWAKVRTEQANAATAAAHLRLDRENAKREAGQQVFTRAQQIVAQPVDLAEKIAKMGGTPAEKTAAAKDLAARTPAGIPEIVRDAKGQPARDASGNIVTQTAPLLDSKGKPYTYPSEAAGIKLDAARTNTETYTNVLDRIVQLRNDFGAEWFKSPEARQMIVNFGEAEGLLKERFGLRTASEGNEKLFEKVIGTKDPTEWTPAFADSVVKALTESRNVATDSFNVALKNEGHYDGKAIEFPNVTENGAASRDAKIESLNARSPFEGVNRAEDVGPFDLPSLKPTVAGLPSRPEHTVDVARRAQALAVRAQAGDAKALEGLVTLSRSANDPEVRTAARILLEHIQSTTPGAGE